MKRTNFNAPISTSFFAARLFKNARFCIICNVFLREYCAPRTEREVKMAKPVKETPILFGEEARQFEVRMLRPKLLSAARIAKIKRDYEFMRKKCVNCSF